MESEAIIYIDHSQVREGKLQELKPAMSALADLVKAKEPGKSLIIYTSPIMERK